MRRAALVLVAVAGLVVPTVPAQAQVPAGTLGTTSMSSPVLVSPADGTVFSTLPRTTTITWQPVTWAVAISITIDCFGCSTPGTWTNFRSTFVRETVTSYTFDWPGPFPGRWRISGFPPAPPGPPPSPTWTFEYTV